MRGDNINRTCYYKAELDLVGKFLAVYKLVHGGRIERRDFVDPKKP